MFAAKILASKNATGKIPRTSIKALSVPYLCPILLLLNSQSARDKFLNRN